MKTEPLKKHEFIELLSYQMRKGKHWKEALCLSWERGGDHGPALQHLRNTHGPEWLSTYENPVYIRDSKNIPDDQIVGQIAVRMVLRNQEVGNLNILQDEVDQLSRRFISWTGQQT